MVTPTPYTESLAWTARTRLEALRAEEVAASLTGLTSDVRYMADLADDIAAAEAMYIGAAAVGVAGCGRCATAG